MFFGLQQQSPVIKAGTERYEAEYGVKSGFREAHKLPLAHVDSLASTKRLSGQTAVHKDLVLRFVAKWCRLAAAAPAAAGTVDCYKKLSVWKQLRAAAHT